MSERKDLTRWNRAGRSRFEYIDGNAVEFLEILRQQLVRRFADSDTGLCNWISPPQQVPDDEAEKADESMLERDKRLSLRKQRLLETYQQDRRDWAWEISRSFARSCHILTEHANAFANEGFLGTATQWEHVRRLVAMLDYYPAPPASAYTWLSLTAKQGQSGIIGKGFQVKNSPPRGGDKVIFETLEDLFIDADLNQLRPRGWNISTQPLQDDAASEESTSTSSTLFSQILLQPASYLQGVGQIQAGKLDALVGEEGFMIKDFLTMDPDSVSLKIETTRLWEWKAKANFLYRFAPPGDWSMLTETILPQIVAAGADELAEQSGNTREMAAALKQAIGMVEVCIDHPRFLELEYGQLVVEQAADRQSVKTRWYVPAKPAVEPGQVAMILDEPNGRAAAVQINRVEEIEGEPAALEVELSTSLLQNEWGQWVRGNTLLHYAPRWHRRSWLNGANVIRTAEAHGLNTDTYVGWKYLERWRFAKIIEADKRNLRLNYAGVMPSAGTPLFLLKPVAGKITAPDLEVIALAGAGEEQVDWNEALSKEPMNTGGSPALSDIFSIKDLSLSNVPLPPLLPPGSLPGIGSFLFPTPFLPIDLVKAAVELMLNLGVMVIPSSGEIVFKGMPFTGLLEGLDLDLAASELFGILDKLEIPDAPDDEKKVIEWHTPDPEMALKELLQSATQEDTPVFQQLSEEYISLGPMLGLNKDDVAVAQVVASNPAYMFDGTPDRLQKGDWIVAEFSQGLRALSISEIQSVIDDDKTESFGLSFSSLPSQPGELRKVHADFRGELVPYNAKLNFSDIDPDNFEFEVLPKKLRVGHQLLVTGCGDPYLVRIIGIEDDRISFEPPLAKCQAGKMLFSGNVVLAGHGETQPQKIIGSGNAAKSNQSFTLKVENLSFTPDPAKSAGVAADIEVDIDGRLWEQVSSLKDSLAEDHHYEIRMTELGHVKIIFGDGANGRRLPTARNNLKVRYRVGSGITGNVAAGSLTKAVKPDPLLDSVAQPLAASGGGDMEDLSTLRNNAPPTVLALKRAVSLSDFSHLASAQSSIWQARAYSEPLHGGRLTLVRVVVVPAGGGFSAAIKNELQAYLQRQSLPGVKVQVDPYIAQPIDLQVTIRVDTSAFLPAEIAADVEAELFNQFALKKRVLGESLYLSEIYQVVESIPGVENSVCVLGEDVQVIHAEDRSAVVHLDAINGSSLIVSTEEYSP